MFERPTGYSMPVAVNLFGSMKRMCMALGVEKLDDLAAEIDELATPKIPSGMLDALKLLPTVNRLRDLMPKTVKDGPCQEVVRRDGTLDDIPILTCWPGDGGRYITFPLVFTQDPETGMRNIGTYRMQVFDGRSDRDALAAPQGRRTASPRRRAARQAHAGGGGARARSGARLFGDRADAGGPRRADAGGFPPPRARRARQVHHHRPRGAGQAQIVLEGYVEPGERRREGPFGDHTGVYSHPDDFPVFHLTCITQRKRPVYLTTVVGIPPMEDYYLGKASERIFLPLIRKTVPEIVDMHFPAEGIFHNLVIISIDKRYPGHARKIMNACWGLGQLMFSKTIIVVDKDVDVQNQSEVAWVVGTHYDPERDIQFTRGPVDDLEDASDLPAYGSKMGIDATRKWPSEGFTRPWPTKISTTPQAASVAEAQWEKIRKGWRA